MPDRDAYDAAIVDAAARARVDLVCLAGFMRLVGAPLLDAFPDRILNIHPSLLPAFPGLDAQRQALEHGVRVSGRDRSPGHVRSSMAGRSSCRPRSRCSTDDTVETLSARILVEEHRIYPEAIRLVLDGGWSIEGRRFVTSSAVLGATAGSAPPLPAGS